MQSVLAELPRWLVLGVAGGLACSVLVAGVFVVGRSWFPDSATDGPSVSGDARRHTEIRRYLLAIDEPFAEGRTVDGHRVEFYLTRRDVAITFDPRTYYDLTGTATTPVLVEHELPGVHLGSRLPFETPPVDRGTPSPTAGRGSLDQAAAYDLLGVPPTATDDELRAAYREKVKSVHPDHGGDPHAFRELNDALAAARDRAAS